MPQDLATLDRLGKWSWPLVLSLCSLKPTANAGAEARAVCSYMCRCLRRRKVGECAYREAEGSCMYGPEEAEVQCSFGDLKLLSRMQPVLVPLIFKEPNLL